MSTAMRENSDLFATKLYCPQALTIGYKESSFLYPIVLEWNSKECLFTTRGRGSSRYKMWCFMMIIVFGIVSVGSCIFTVVKQKHFNVGNVVFASALVPLGLVILGCSWVMYWNADDIVVGFGRMSKVLKELDGQLRNHERKNPILRNEDRIWKRIGFFMKCASQAVLLIPYMIPPFVIWERIDPYINIYQYFFWLPRKSLFSPAFWGRLILGIVTLLEACRSWSVCMGTLCFWLEMQMRYISILKVIPKQRFHRFYIICRLTLSTWEHALSEWLRVLMCTIFWAVVACIVGSVRYVEDIPLSVYLFFPTCGFVNGAVVFLLFPFVMGFHEITKKMLKDSRKDSKYCKVWLKQIRSMKPISLKFGQSFILKRETKCTFYDGIVQRTVDGLLL